MYTHLVKVQRQSKFCGIVSADFRTTADAVEIHRVALAKQQRAGDVVSFEIVKL